MEPKLFDQHCQQCHWWSPVRECTTCHKLICILCWLTGNGQCEICHKESTRELRHRLAHC